MKLMLSFCAAILISIFAIASVQAQPVVRDHRGQPQQKPPPPGKSGWQPPPPPFCFGGLFGGTTCTQLGPKVRDHRKKK